MKSLSVKLGVILIIGLLILGNAEPWLEHWKPYFGNEYFVGAYETQSITRPSKNIVRVWARMDFTEKGVLNWVAELGKRYDNLSHVIFLEEINCAEKKSRSLSQSSYDNKGDVIISSNPPSDWEFIVPESIIESLYKEVCK